MGNVKAARLSPGATTYHGTPLNSWRRFDHVVRFAYRASYLALRVWWFLRRPRTYGAVVALWNDGRILLVRTSYRSQYALPGGFLKRGETALQAALRELSEELRIDVSPDDLRIGWHGLTRYEQREDITTSWELVLSTPPRIRLDRREIVWAGWKTPAEARSLLLAAPIRAYLEEKKKTCEV